MLVLVAHDEVDRETVSTDLTTGGSSETGSGSSPGGSARTGSASAPVADDGLLERDRLLADDGSTVDLLLVDDGSSTVTRSSSTGNVTAGVLGLAGTVGAAATLGETCGTATGGALASTTIVPPAMSPRR